MSEKIRTVFTYLTSILCIATLALILYSGINISTLATTTASAHLQDNYGFIEQDSVASGDCRRLPPAEGPTGGLGGICKRIP